MMAEQNIAIVDSGGTNIASIRFALERLGAASSLCADPEAILKADKVILPGVGAAPEGMRRLRERGLIDCVKRLRRPTLGVCLGMQLLFEASEEGDTETLGLIPGVVRRIPAAPGIQVPHMGWNRLSVLRDSPLLAGIGGEDYVYFVHSFAAPINDHTLAGSEHGIAFAAVVQHENFFGAQFHPERSGPVGARLLKNFLEL